MAIPIPVFPSLFTLLISCIFPNIVTCPLCVLYSLSARLRRPSNSKRDKCTTYPVQNHINLASSIYHRVLTPQLHYLSQYAHNAVLELREVRLQDARGLRVVHCCKIGWRCVVLVRGRLRRRLCRERRDEMGVGRCCDACCVGNLGLMVRACGRRDASVGQAR